jgi:hypothetical protein
MLKIFNPDVNVNPNKENNFLEYNPTTPDYDLIVINPPFTEKIGSKKDSRYYLDFLFHCLYLMNRTYYIYEPTIIFISPNIINNQNDKSIYTLNDILKFISKSKLLSICHKYKMNPTDKEIKYLINDNPDIFKSEKELEKAEEFKNNFEDNFDFYNGSVNHICSGFGGTNISAYVNVISCYKKTFKKVLDPWLSKKVVEPWLI